MAFPWQAIGAGAIGGGIDKGGELINAGLTGLMSFGFANKARNQYASQVRHLRRREYQDMMFSMKQAGLNPILAAGATPGHSAAMVQQAQLQGGGGAGVASAVAANRQARVGEIKAPAEIGKLVTARYLDAANIARTYMENAYTAESTRKVMAETKLALEQSGNAAMQRLLWQREAEKAGMSAKDIEAHINVNRGDPRAIAGRMLHSAQQTDKALGGWSGLGDKIGNAIWDSIHNADKAAPPRSNW